MICPEPFDGFQLIGRADNELPPVRTILTAVLAFFVTRAFNWLASKVPESTKASSNDRLPAVLRVDCRTGVVVAMPRMLHPNHSALDYFCPENFIRCNKYWRGIKG